MDIKHLATPVMSRRAILRAGCAFGVVALTPRGSWPASTSPREYRLVAGTGRTPIVGASAPDTAVWCYNDQVPGPEIRVRQGERLRVVVENRLAEATTVHWHGVRVPNAMDGVPDLTQRPIAPGESFVYEFDVPDAGTYWYHPHQRSFEQVGRGLYGPLIVEEPEPIAVDRDLTWVLSDWRLRQDASISPDFGNPMDLGMAGRIGNTVTVNGRIPGPVTVRRGERLRLRLVNAANARIFGLTFQGHRPRVIALDGQPIPPHEPAGGRIVLGPAMRADLILEMTGASGERFAITDTFYPRLAYTLLDLVYDTQAPLRNHPSAALLGLPANTMPEPNLTSAVHHRVIFTGGMMSMMGGMGGMMNGGMMSGMMGGMMGRGMMGGMMHGGTMWTINGVAATDQAMEPFLTLERRRTYVLAMANDTAWYHPIHLHGHAFRVLTRNGQPTQYREWQDTVLMTPRERVEIAFVADNPGNWMFHCHILEHQDAGMMGVIRVA